MKRTLHRDTKRAGLTLIETLVALSILSVIVVALSGVLTSSLQARQTSAQRSVANRYAESILNRYKSHWANDVAYDAFDPPPNLPPVPGGFDSPLEIDIDGYTASGVGVAANSDPPPDLRQVTVTLKRQGKVMADLTTEIGKPRVQR